jgi:hypothetical protein
MKLGLGTGLGLRVRVEPVCGHEARFRIRVETTNALKKNTVDN